METIINTLYATGIVPVIALSNADNAVPLAKALIAGGLPCAEVTFRTKEAAESIRRIAAEVPDILLGAGTVLTTAQVDEAVASGASFIVSPGYNPKVVDYCLQKNIPILPGCATPSDMERAIEAGLRVVKFFPAEAAGGLDYLKSVAAPYSMLRFMPTGGISTANVNNYLAFDKIIACGGSWMVKKDLVDQGRFDEITALTREAVQQMLGLKLAHVGINAANADEALKAAKLFELMFGFAVESKSSSVFAGPYVEVMKEPFLGKNGHIAIATNDINRAIASMERRGFEFNKDSLKTGPTGKPVALYFKDEIAGFAVHLLQK